MITNRRDLLKFMALSGAALAMPGGAFAASDAKILRIGLSAYPSNFRPWVDVGYSGQLVSALINRSLISYDEKGQLVGDLAESWNQVSELIWLFELREVKFSNGQPVTSQDVKWTVEQISAEGSGAHMHDAFKRIDHVEIIDDKKFHIVTKTPDVTIPSLMAYPFLAVLVAGSTTQNEQGIGAGPYVLESAEKGVGITLTASQYYFKKGLPSFETVQITPYEDESLRVSALSAGDVDLIDYVPWSAMSSIEKDNNLKLDTVPSGAFMFLSFNGAGPFKDSRLRQAVNFGIRRQEIVDTVFFGRGSVLGGVPRPSVSPYFHKELAEYWTYDPERAKKLLKEAGKETGLNVTLLSNSQYSMHRDIAVLIKTHLAEVGINVNLDMPDWATRVTLGVRGEFDFGIDGTGIDTYDPDSAASFIDPSISPAYNSSRNFEVPGLTALLEKGRRESDETKRIAIYAEIDKLVCENASFGGLAYRATGFASSKNLKNLQLLPDQLSPFSGILFDKLAL